MALNCHDQDAQRVSCSTALKNAFKAGHARIAVINITHRSILDAVFVVAGPDGAVGIDEAHQRVDVKGPL
jgi:hypothetical protein